MALMDESVVSQLRQEFERLVNPVRLAVFSQTLADPGSEQVRRLVEELGALDQRLSVESYNFILDQQAVDALRIARIPALAILGAETDYGIRFYGLPSGHEFGTLVDAVLDVSSGDSGLGPETREALGALTQPVHLQVFSTPTCPYCPQAVRMAFRFALESNMISADGVEITGYPDLARRYGVSSVPKTVVGDEIEFVGSGPESLLLQHVRDAAAKAGGLGAA
jgi:glutaredoxin-like protein